MHWNNSQVDGLPKDREEILISVDGVYYIAMYDEEKKLFRVENEQKETFFRVNEQVIYWTEYRETE
jgi:hypothetical protein